MPHKVTCPHCKAEHDVADVVPQSEHRERLKAKDGEIGALTTRLTEANGRAGNYDAVVAERDRMRGELTAAQESGVRAKAYAALGIPDADGVRQGFELVYQSQIAGIEDASKRPAFVDWLGQDATKAHPLLAPQYGKGTGAPAGAPAGPKVGPDGKPLATTGTSKTETGAESAGAGRKISSRRDLEDYFKTPEYKALKPEEKKARRDELQAQVDKLLAAQGPQ